MNTEKETAILEAILVAITGVLTDEEIMRIQHRLKKQEMFPAVEWLAFEINLREKEEKEKWPKELAGYEPMFKDDYHLKE